MARAMRTMAALAAGLLFPVLFAAAAAAQTETETETETETGAEAAPATDAMTPERMMEIIARLDADMEGAENGVQFTIAERQILLVYDAASDRMRIMSPTAPAEGLDEDGLRRLMQANFDSALDARYAVAHDVVWSVFIHPLSSLNDDDFIEGIGQTVNLALTFGTTYTSGALIYGGGDSDTLLRRELIDELLERGRDI